MAGTLASCLERIDTIRFRARQEDGDIANVRWPMIILRTPKGWTGPRAVDGKPVEDTWRSHQVPLAATRENPEHLRLLEEWLRSYRPEELFDEHGAPRPETTAVVPPPDRRISSSPHANGGLLLRDLLLPDFRDYAVEVERPGVDMVEATRVLGGFLRDVVAANPHNFRIMGLMRPSPTGSARSSSPLTGRGPRNASLSTSSSPPMAGDGGPQRAALPSWLEGYLLTGRHGLFNSYEAFIHIVDSMVNQHAKWLKVSRELPWRRPISSLNYLLSSHVWRQDHNGFSHQDPGFIDHVVNKKPEIIRVYLPPDCNTLLCTMDHCLRSRNFINVVIAGKQPQLTYLPMEAAIAHCTRGAGIWEWASSDEGAEPDVVLACAGDVPTWRRWPQRTCSAATCLSCGCVWSTWWT